MTTELEDYVELDGKRFPKKASREVLETAGARYLKTDRFNINGIEQDIEYMVMEGNSMMVWKRFGNGETDYTLHLFAPRIVKFS